MLTYQVLSDASASDSSLVEVIGRGNLFTKVCVYFSLYLSLQIGISMWIYHSLCVSMPLCGSTVCLLVFLCLSVSLFVCLSV